MPSTVIRHIDYEPAQRRLHVTFVSGRRYVYDHVPPHIYHLFRNAPSKGEFFNAAIRNIYAYHEEQRFG